jgi:hypothetical protein
MATAAGDWSGRDADKILQGMAAVAKRACDDGRADREYEQRQIAAAQAKVNVPEADDEQPSPSAISTAQVPKWLPVPHTSPASRHPLAQRSSRSL